MKDKIKRAAGHVSDFIAGRGFYIVLFLCIAAIGVSGYILFFSGSSPAKYVTEEEAFASEQIPELEADMEQGPDSEVSKETSVDIELPVNVPSSVTKAESKSVVSKPVFVWPLKGEILMNFARSELLYSKTLADWRAHMGVDIAAGMGAEVMSISSGVVESVEDDDLMGTTVVINHGDKLYSVYSNLAELPTVKAGDKVSSGDIIGAIGETALLEIGEVPHLHFEMVLNGEQINPDDYLPAR